MSGILHSRLVAGVLNLCRQIRVQRAYTQICRVCEYLAWVLTYVVPLATCLETVTSYSQSCRVIEQYAGL